MTRDILKEMLAQHVMTCGYTFNEITEENSTLRLNQNTASVGFIYRHIGEVTHMLAQFLGVPANVPNTTMGHVDSGKVYHVEESKELVESAYAMLERLIENLSEEEWMEMTETPFFGQVSKIRLFAHILYHITYHAGQIHLTLKRGA